MACSNLDRETGFATPAAIVVSLAIATVASAALLTATTRLTTARADYDKTRLIYALDGAQVSAALMLESESFTPHAWAVGSPVGPIALRAEPEDAKLSVAAAVSQLPDVALDALRVGDGGALRSRLDELKALPPSRVALEALDASAGWRSCARRLVSPWGRAGVLRYVDPTPLTMQDGPARVGQTWRVRAELDGWVDQRTFLVTGSSSPLLRERSFTREQKGAPRCDDLLDALGRATPATP